MSLTLTCLYWFSLYFILKSSQKNRVALLLLVPIFDLANTLGLALQVLGGRSRVKTKCRAEDKLIIALEDTSLETAPLKSRGHGLTVNRLFSAVITSRTKTCCP